MAKAGNICSAAISAALLIASAHAETPAPIASSSRTSSAIVSSGLSLNVPQLVEDVERLRLQFRQPGIALVLASADNTVLMRGFGVRRMGLLTPVDADTTFAIASCTKSFAAATVARLVEQRRMTWDDPVHVHLPEYVLHDPQLTRSVTVRDLLSMRTGLAAAGAARPTLRDRRQLIERLQYLPSVAPFRSELIYTTDNYSVIGEIVARVSGRTWESFVQHEFFAPLGMTSSDVDHRVARGRDNSAVPHARVNGELRPVRWVYEDHVASPAGGVNSTVRDLSWWLQLQLSEGTLAGRQLLEKKSVREMHRPHMPDLGREDSTILTDAAGEGANGVQLESYGMGWMTHVYAGHRVVWHDGNTVGFRCVLGLLPDRKLGFAVLLNGDQDYLPYALMQRVIDTLIGEEPRDWGGIYLAMQQQEVQSSAQDAAAMAKARAADRRSSNARRLFVASWVGSYSGASVWGDIDVSPAPNGRLLMRAGALEYELEHVAGGRFAATRLDVPERGRAFFVEFIPGENSAGAVLQMPGSARLQRRSMPSARELPE
jgi:CubicO group peptidase (beta-lactamase class C family)